MATTREHLIQSRTVRRMLWALGLAPLVYAGIAFVGMWLGWPAFESGLSPSFLLLATPFLVALLLAASTRRVRSTQA